MSKRLDKARVGKTHDRRRKLTDEQREEIREMHREGLGSQREIAECYGVSRRLIQFIVCAEKLEENKARRKERGGSAQYYDREKHVTATRKHRHYKRHLIDSKQIES